MNAALPFSAVPFLMSRMIIMLNEILMSGSLGGIDLNDPLSDFQICLFST